MFNHDQAAAAVLAMLAYGHMACEPKEPRNAPPGSGFNKPSKGRKRTLDDIRAKDRAVAKRRRCKGYS